MKLVCLLFAALAAWGQASVFEVASVKPSQSQREGHSIRNERGGRFETEHTSLFDLILYALPAQDFQVLGGPGWIKDARFDIAANIGGADDEVKNPAERFARIRARLMHLLEDRFQLQLREEQREVPIYELGVEKSGIRMNAAEPLGNVDMSGGAAGTTLIGKGMTMTRLADVLSGIAHRPVHDSTGLNGAWDIDLKYSLDLSAPDAAAPANDSSLSYPTLFTALREQLGLHLTSKKGMAPVWVVVRAEKPGDN